jgi:response regulator RpfG family c-di-GMP phosphodiesterase
LETYLLGRRQASPIGRAKSGTGVVQVVCRILVVDDEPDVRASLRELLLVLPDCSIAVAGSLGEARRKAAEEAWDLIISDERLPDGRGVHLLAEAALSSPTTWRVLMSAFQDFDMLQRAVNAAHIDEFIQKPWDPAHVLARVQRIVEERSVEPPQRKAGSVRPRPGGLPPAEAREPLSER